MFFFTTLLFSFHSTFLRSLTFYYFLRTATFTFYMNVFFTTLLFSFHTTFVRFLLIFNKILYFRFLHTLYILLHPISSFSFTTTHFIHNLPYTSYTKYYLHLLTFIPKPYAHPTSNSFTLLQTPPKDIFYIQYFIPPMIRSCLRKRKQDLIMGAPVFQYSSCDSGFKSVLISIPTNTPYNTFHHAWPHFALIFYVFCQ